MSSQKYKLSSMTKNVKKSWLELMQPEFEKSYFADILDLIKKHQKKYPTDHIFPYPSNVFRVFTQFDLTDTRVVFLGQDPYHGCQYSYETDSDDSDHEKETVVPQAMGYSFSVPRDVPIPPSLRNIYKELDESVEGFIKPKHGDLSRWVEEENILLLNAALTVRQKTAGSHLKKWEKFTDFIIQQISEKCEGVVFILLGNFAKKKADLIDEKKHCIITGVHPSPLSASRGFFGSDIFNQANTYLEKQGKDPVNWNVNKKSKSKPKSK